MSSSAAPPECGSSQASGGAASQSLSQPQASSGLGAGSQDTTVSTQDSEAPGYDVVDGERVAKSYTKCRKHDRSTRPCPYCDSVSFYHHPGTGKEKAPYYVCITKKIDTCRDCAACAPLLLRHSSSDNLCVCPLRDRCTCNKRVRVCDLAKCRTCKIKCTTGDTYSTNTKTLAKFAAKRRAEQEKDAAQRAIRRANVPTEVRSILEAGDPSLVRRLPLSALDPATA